jgi:hypothetical protein
LYISRSGRKLVEVKERVAHGQYTAFVTERLGWSESAGRKFVSVFEMFKTVNFTGSTDLTIDASSLYLIAAPSTPEEGRGSGLGARRGGPLQPPRLSLS